MLTTLFTPCEWIHLVPISTIKSVRPDYDKKQSAAHLICFPLLLDVVVDNISIGLILSNEFLQ